ncbi:MAG: glycosyl transferase family 1, partial [Desulfomonilia bacterium]|nr:glycosyl transferase family 1 [Desulfomonilia bacterium]
VVTDVGDSALLVGDTGMVVEKRNPNALAQAWSELLDAGEEKRRHLGQKARERIVEHYGITTMNQRYESLYTDISKQNTRR